MRKFFLLFIMFFSMLISQAQEYVGVYYQSLSGDQHYKKVECTDPDGEDFKVFIETTTNHSWEHRSYLVINGKDLAIFKSWLIKARDKFVTWKKIAAVNDVANVKLDMSIYLPKMTVSWKGKEWWSASVPYTPVYFVVNDMGFCFMHFSAHVISKTNELIEHDVVFELCRKSEFDELIELLDINKMREIYRQRHIERNIFIGYGGSGDIQIR